MGQVQNEEHLCLIAVIGMERPNKATVEWELEERDGVKTRAHGLRSLLLGSLRLPRSGSSATARRRWIWPSNLQRTRWWRAMGLAKSYRPSLSLSPPLLCLPLFSSPGPVPAWFPEPSPDGGEGRPRSRRPQEPTAGRRGRGRAEPRCWSRFLSLSTPIPCPPSRHWGGGEAWAGLLALRGPGPFYRSVSGDRGGDPGPGSGRPAGRPRSGWRVPDTCEYEGGYILGFGGFGL